MRIELLELLKSAKISHPTSVESVEVTACNLRAVIKGTPWWKTNPVHQEEIIEFTFEGVSDGNLELSTLGTRNANFNDDEMLEDFDLRPLAEFEWAQPKRHSIYCSAPLAEPLSVLTVVDDYLKRVDADTRLEEFLNTGGSLGKFVEITASHSYLLATTPDAMLPLLCGELKRQSVPHNIISYEAGPAAQLRVQFGGGSFLCARAFASFE